MEICDLKYIINYSDQSQQMDLISTLLKKSLRSRSLPKQASRKFHLKVNLKQENEVRKARWLNHVVPGLVKVRQRDYHKFQACSGYMEN